MRVPIRKPGKFTHLKPDAHLTQDKYNEFAAKLEKLKKIVRPRAAEEVKRLALMGDFSENAAYQIAKGRLRGLNQRILDLEDILKRAVIIEPRQDDDVVRLGRTVVIESAGKEKIYQILGSAETNPRQGVISHISPLGAALIGRRAGEMVKIQLGDKQVEYKIIKIE